jgi:hypothetical protein
MIVDAVIAVSGLRPSPRRFDAVANRLIGAPVTQLSYDKAAREVAHAIVSAENLASNRALSRDIEELVKAVLATASRRARSKHDPFEDASVLPREHPLPGVTKRHHSLRLAALNPPGNRW